MEEWLKTSAANVRHVAELIGFASLIATGPSVVLWKWLVKPRIDNTKKQIYDFVERVDTGLTDVTLLKGRVAEVELVSNDTNIRVARVEHDLGPNGGKSNGARIRRTEAQVRVLLDALNTPVWEADESGKNTSINRSFARTFGYSVEEMHGDGWRRIVWLPLLEKYDHGWQIAVDRLYPVFQAETVFECADGRLLDVTVFAARIETDTINHKALWHGTVTVDGVHKERPDASA